MNSSITSIEYERRPLDALAALPDPLSQQERRRVVMIVEDVQRDRELMFGHLNGAFEVVAAGSGREALEIVREEVPDIFLLSANMRDMDGYALCQRLREDPVLAAIPVIFVASSLTTEDIVRGFVAGAVDYFIKTVSRAEVLARVETHIRLHEALDDDSRVLNALDSNPLTRLPGNRMINRVIQKAIEQGADQAIIYCDLDNFKPYNDYYGFSRGDQVLLHVAETLSELMRELRQNGNGFLGHVGGDDFVMLVPSGQADSLGREIIRRFDSFISAFYDEVDRTRGCIEAPDRQGRLVRYPLLSVSLAGVYLRNRCFRHFLEVTSVCAQVKDVVKSIKGSHLLFDRRSGEFN